MTTATAEQAILDAVKPQLYIGGEWRDGGEGGTLDGRGPGDRRDARRGRRRHRRRRQGGARRRRTRPSRSGATPPRASAARSCAAPTTLITERADDLALLMTLEMGKPVAESKAEIAYAANFFRWYAEEAVRINGRFTVNEAGAGRVLTMQAAGRPVRVHHAVELPAGDGHAQDRPGHRRRLHDGRQAGQADAAVDARAGPDPRGGRAARRRAQRHHRAVVGRARWSR